MVLASGASGRQSNPIFLPLYADGRCLHDSCGHGCMATGASPDSFALYGSLLLAGAQYCGITCCGGYTVNLMSENVWCQRLCGNGPRRGEPGLYFPGYAEED